MCIALLEHHCGKHFPGIASALINKALVLMQQGNDIDAIASLKKAQRIHESICGEQKLFCQLNSNNFNTAVYVRTLSSVTHKSLGGDLRQRSEIFHNLGVCYVSFLHAHVFARLNSHSSSQDRLDDVSQAGQWYRKALTTLDTASGGIGTCRDTVCASLCSNLGSILAESKRPKDAIPLLERALLIREERLGQNHPDTIDVMYDLGILFANVGMMKQAASRLSAAVQFNDCHSSANDAKRVLEALVKNSQKESSKR